ncbi:sulfatase-like hydrolase/transferase [Candidatus Binatia bacterium]|nr:sulfatase-like hydrolase/transferase [Candidatus Binatia bacterium]
MDTCVVARRWCGAKRSRWASFLGAALGLASVLFVDGCSDAPPRSAPQPNILFVVMDDVGIDQMQVFGYGGDDPPQTPTIAALADDGIRFRNTWSMPACSTSRAVIFEARYPLRTNVQGALGPNDLANSMVSPFEVTLPKLLAQRGYTSALFGKFHIGLQGNDPAGYAMVHDLGWDYFDGWLDETGDPSSIDTTAGGVAPLGTWSCGFVPGAADGGADTGACYQADGSCSELASSGPVPPGRTCRDRGGILDPGKSCQSPPPVNLDFTTLSGHYVSPLVINHEDGSVDRIPPTDRRARTFRTTEAVDAAVSWIRSRPSGQPWMATVSFSAAHTPLMQPPADTLGEQNRAASGLDCNDTQAQRLIMNLMVESIDAEVARLLVETGLAERAPDGSLVYRPEQTDTVVVIVGDNGSLGGTVKQPFDPSRAKGTAYQTGVWVPLVIAGPLVVRPGRDVEHMVNIADLYTLFGEIAGIEDVRAQVPRPIDAEPMLPYLREPGRASIRASNFTQVGPNLQANGAINGPCTIGSTCTQIPVTKSVCHDNNGTWYGAEPDDPGVPPGGFTYCCEVSAYLAAQGQQPLLIAPLSALAIRDDRYKIVRNSGKAYVSQEQPCVDGSTNEFYAIDEAVPTPELDEAGTQLDLDALTPEQQRSYDELSARLQALLDSNVPCPGDGNIDLVVDDLDLSDWRFYADSTGLSSWYDLNLDGLTNDADRTIIQQNLGLRCSRR